VSASNGTGEKERPASAGAPEEMEPKKKGESRHFTLKGRTRCTEDRDLRPRQLPNRSAQGRTGLGLRQSTYMRSFVPTRSPMKEAGFPDVRFEDRGSKCAFPRFQTIAPVEEKRRETVGDSAEPGTALAIFGHVKAGRPGIRVGGDGCHAGFRVGVL